jgi:hypothetical protein
MGIIGLALQRRYSIWKVFSVFHGVVLNDYRINWELEKIFSELLDTIEKRKLSLRIEPFREVISREDSAQWMKETFKNFILVKDLRKKSEVRLDIEGVRKLLDEISRRKKIWHFWKIN